MKRMMMCVLCAVSVQSGAAAADDAANLSEFFTEGDVTLSFRYRLELVDQDGFARDATASTLLTKLSYGTASLGGFSGYVEFTNTTSVGAETYNSTTNGNTTRPVVADPELTELNQAYFAYRKGMVAVKAGRQGINTANQRFIGTVGFRQNDQTFDAAALTLAPDDQLSLGYSYVWNVNRIFGRDHPAGDLKGDIHLVDASYGGFTLGKLSTYAYMLDFDTAGALSSATYGARLSGKQKVGAATLGYELEYAHQSDHGDNPVDYSADYRLAAADVTLGGFTLGGGYELLGSDGTAAFQTPLATLHKFNGWADKFLGTPVNGLRDLYASVGYKVQHEGALKGLLVKVIYHDFNADEGGAAYGGEWDFLVSKGFGKIFTASVKAAFYDADGFGADTTKLWLTLGAKF